MLNFLTWTYLFGDTLTLQVIYGTLLEGLGWLALLTDHSSSLSAL